MSQSLIRRAHQARLLAMLGIVLMAGGAGAASGGRGDDRSHRRNNPVLDWNRLAMEILPVEAGPVIDSRAMAILQAAVHDAVNGGQPRASAGAALSTGRVIQSWPVPGLPSEWPL